MVAIKDMEMPSCCSQCDLCVEDEYADMTCVLLGSDWEETDYNENHRDENCPFVEIEEHKVGKWIYDKTSQNWRCSKCNETPKTLGYVGTSAFMTEHFKFCNHCGSEMVGAENE